MSVELRQTPEPILSASRSLLRSASDAIDNYANGLAAIVEPFGDNVLAEFTGVAFITYKKNHESHYLRLEVGQDGIRIKDITNPPEFFKGTLQKTKKIPVIEEYRVKTTGEVTYEGKPLQDSDKRIALLAQRVTDGELYFPNGQNVFASGIRRKVNYDNVLSDMTYDSLARTKNQTAKDRAELERKFPQIQERRLLVAELSKEESQKAREAAKQLWITAMEQMGKRNTDHLVFREIGEHKEFIYVKSKNKIGGAYSRFVDFQLYDWRNEVAVGENLFSRELVRYDFIGSKVVATKIQFIRDEKETFKERKAVERHEATADELENMQERILAAPATQIPAWNKKKDA